MPAEEALKEMEKLEEALKEMGKKWDEFDANSPLKEMEKLSRELQEVLKEMEKSGMTLKLTALPLPAIEATPSKLTYR